MDETRLAELEALREEATDAVWEFDPTNYGRAHFGYGLICPAGQHYPTGVHIEAGGDFTGDACGYSDEHAKALGRYLVAIHNAAPDLLATVRRQREEIARLREALRSELAFVTVSDTSGVVKRCPRCWQYYQSEPHKPGCPFAVLNEGA
jgi:hypothetical protein